MRSPSIRPLTLLACALPALVVLPGCYHRVVGARGPNAHAVTVHEANLTNERIPIVDDVEDAVFGERPPLKSR